uniref:Secreted protein n=1 Tax=Oryza brachyantha TaxID=4533 RepID=J3LFS9_ORYBR
MAGRRRRPAGCRLLLLLLLRAIRSRKAGGGNNGAFVRLLECHVEMRAQASKSKAFWIASFTLPEYILGKLEETKLWTLTPKMMGRYVPSTSL